ncbi:MAG: ABC transporter ATP-binding protein [Pseudomonadota bacterium]
MDLAIDCEKLNKHYPHFDLADVDLKVPTGTVMGFVGPNGAGKSTTMQIIMGLTTRDSGSVTVLGHPVPEQQVAAKQGIGYVTEDMRLYAGQTLGFHMRFVRSLYPGWDDAYASELLRRFKLDANQKTKGFSHGQRVKALLLLALAHHPRLLILDEPTTGLDPVARQEVLRGMMEVIQDESRSVLFSSHNTLDVEQISDHIAFIQDGRIVAANDKESFLDSWRRIRIELPAASAVPCPEKMVSVTRSGDMTVVVTNCFDESLPGLLGGSACVRQVTRMTLEEIFLESVAAAPEVIA